MTQSLDGGKCLVPLENAGLRPFFGPLEPSLTRERSLVRTQPRPFFDLRSIGPESRLSCRHVGGTCAKGKEATEPEKAVEVMLAEFNAMRAEKVSYLTGQAAIVALGITALGVVASFAVKDGHDRLLLVVPPLVMLVVLGHTAGSYRSNEIGNYIRDELWGELEGKVGALPSWQRWIARERLKPIAIFKVLFLDLPPAALFIAASVYALCTVSDREFLWCAGVVMTAVSVTVPIVVLSRIIATSNDSRERETSKAAAAPRGCCPPDP